MTEEINTNDLDTVAKIMSYIKRHEELLGFKPLAIGLTYNNRVKVLREMGASNFAARCTNLKANLLGAELIEVL